MRIAFIIQVHKHPAQLHRLLTKLQHPFIDCYVHVDAKSKLEDYAEALSLPQVYTVKNRLNVTWAGWSQVAATLQSMQATRDSGHAYTYITMLSGQDYLIKPVDYIYNYLTGSDTRQYIDLIPEEELQTMLSKMNNYHLVDYSFPGKYKFAQLLTKLLPARKPPLGLKFYSGSTWWSLTQDCVNFCLDYIQQHPSLARFFKYTWGPDEFIFHTILMKSKYKDQVTGYNLHYIDWSEKKANPKMLALEDLEAMMQSDRLLARKFDMEKDPALLDEIDAAIKRLFP
jgi:hypothetical protein